MAGKTEAVEAVIQLTRENCYYMNHGICSLSLIEDAYVNPPDPLKMNELLFCPRLYRQMCGKEPCRLAPVPAARCGCSHVQIFGRVQRACIAERRKLTLPVKWKDDRPLCSVCSEDSTNAEGTRILPLEITSAE